MSILRLPFSLALVWAANTIATAPQPPPRPEERVGFDISSAEAFARLNSIKACLGMAGLGEAVIISATVYPSNPWLKNAATFLVDSSPSSLNIRLTWSFIAAWIFAILGAIIRRRCYKVLGEMFTYQLSIRKRHKLVTWGPYAVVRHPSYTGVIMTLVGGSICFSTPGAWTFEYSHSPWTWFIMVFCWFMTVITVQFSIKRSAIEDKMLQVRFGKEWELWTKRVPCRLIPGVY